MRRILVFGIILGLAPFQLFSPKGAHGRRGTRSSMRELHCAAGIVGTALGTAAAAAPAGSRSHHARTLSGAISSVNTVGKTFNVKAASGKEIVISWTNATKVTGGSLQVGEQVEVRWMQKGGKNIATSIRVGSSKK